MLIIDQLREFFWFEISKLDWIKTQYSKINNFKIKSTTLKICLKLAELNNNFNFTKFYLH